MTPEDRIKQLGSADASGPTESEWLEFRSSAHRSLARRRMAAAVGGLGLVVAVVAGAYAVTNQDTGDRPGPDVAATPSVSPTDDPSPDTSPSTDEKPQEHFVQLWYIEKDDTLLLAHWPIEDESPERAAVELLVSFMPGPLGETGVTSAFPDGVELVDLSIENGTANVTLGGNVEDMDQEWAFAQLTYTLTQFPSVQDVVIGLQTPTFTDAGPPKTRKTYEHLLPPIVVESPMDGSEVYRSIELSGIANVFEANVSWRLIDRDGNVFKEGFVTATCGSGCWGTFEDRITLERVPDSSILLQVFQSSAEDGSPMNVVTVPLNVRFN